LGGEKNRENPTESHSTVRVDIQERVGKTRGRAATKGTPKKKKDRGADFVWQ